LLVLTLLNVLELAWYAPFKFKKSNLWGAVQNGRGTPSGVLIFWLSVCQPSLVSPPLFDSNVVKLLYSQRSPLCVLFLLIYWPLPNSLYLYHLNTLENGLIDSRFSAPYESLRLKNHSNNKPEIVEHTFIVPLLHARFKHSI
ncbi:hypothetical protein ABLU31_08730, partial [Acinetobacter seifertii]